MAHQSDIDFVSLGTVDIDEIRVPGCQPMLDVLGGSGAFSTLGFRIFNGGAQAQTTGCLVLAGNDFPDAARRELEQWGATLVVKEDAQNASTRGLVKYAESMCGPKSYTHTHTTTPLTPVSMDLPILLLSSNTFHFLATPKELLDQVPFLTALRKAHGIKAPALIIWEPTPSSCVPANRPSFLTACKIVDVFSPNHVDLCALFSDIPEKNFDRKNIVARAYHFVGAKSWDKAPAMVLVHCGEHGSLLLPRDPKPKWLPAYYGQDAEGVVDATGAGSAFLGGFAAGWIESGGNVKEASVYGAVSASFAVEQVGLPVLTGGGKGERWNGVAVGERMKVFRKKLEDMEMAEMMEAMRLASLKPIKAMNGPDWISRRH
ncbi:Ribokinase-like protein [Ophiobolus disseminans]|uniref:Ribokinase-like protein n=1 Tax=Ophiobolus disseminans TaxID=1469910 RepID=A0A6A7A6Y3_9PLEO|nr:Ribokinase-like protein [Ophiobolus disseminans]